MNLRQAARVSEARIVLTQLRFPAAQTNPRSALVLLGLLDLPPRRPWSSATSARLWRIAELMQWMREHYGQDYAPNTRETIRRQTLHQFAGAELIVQNPDDPSRPVNSPATCYQVARPALELLRTHDDEGFGQRVTAYLAGR